MTSPNVANINRRCTRQVYCRSCGISCNDCRDFSRFGSMDSVEMKASEVMASRVRNMYIVLTERGHL